MSDFGILVFVIVITIYIAFMRKKEEEEIIGHYDDKRKDELKKLIEERKERTLNDIYDNEKFWELIDQTRERSRESYKNQLGLLKDKFNKFSPEELIMFDNKLNELYSEACTWDLYGASSIIFKNNNIETLMLLNSWIVTRGEIVHNNSLVNHDILVNHDFKDFDGRVISDIVAEVYYRKTDEFIPVDTSIEMKLAGDKWTDKELPGRFVNIWTKYA